ncbi:MAG: hypothetical protein LBH00_02875 [Planctomycetaceae bacterium]|jgi:hypothetical protein|nr:hypothetical protein [Planctomycetaceae bacterium]
MRRIFPFLMIMVLILTGCEPADIAPDKQPPADPVQTSGAWDTARWLAWINSRTNDRLNGDGWIGGVGYSEESVAAFCHWAGEYFPQGIPKNPLGRSGAWRQNTLAATKSFEWAEYMENNPAVLAAFPGDFDAFCFWAQIWFVDTDMPNIPPNVAPVITAERAFRRTETVVPLSDGSGDLSYTDAGMSSDLL